MRDPLDFSDHKGHTDQAGQPFGTFLSRVFKKIFTPENLWALLLFLIVVALIVFTTDDSPVWIYQGF